MRVGLRMKVLLPLVPLSVLLLAFLYGYWLPRSLKNLEDDHRVSVERHVESVAEALVPLLLARQLDTVYEDLDAVRARNKEWVSVQVLDDKDRMIYPLKTSRPESRSVAADDVSTIEQPISYLDVRLGKLIVKVDFAPKLFASKQRHWELMTALLIIILGYVATIGFVLERAATRPVNLLAHASKELAEGDFSAALPRTSDDEVGTLVNSFRSMRDAISKYQADLRMASAYNRSLIESSLDPLVTIGPDGKITDVNSSTESVTGYSREALIGTDFSDYFTQPDKARAGYQQVFREGAVRDYALEIRHRDGHVTPVLYNASVYRNQAGEVIGVFAAARDITERARMEEDLRKLNEELEERVKRRTAELEDKNEELQKTNRLFVGRELRMVELKKQLRDLEGGLKREE